MEKPWFEVYPDKLQKELSELEKAGIGVEKDEYFFNEGCLRLSLSVPYEGEEYNLVATYPFNYPYFRPQIQAPGITLKRHQHPFAKTLCMLSRSTWYWNVDWTLAEYLKNQFGKVLATGAIGELNEVAKNENEQAEPFTDYYAYENETVVLIDSAFEINESQLSGSFRVGFVGQPTIRPKLLVLEVLDDTGEVIYKIPEELKKCLHPDLIRTEYKWHNISDPIEATTANDAIRKLRDDGLELNSRAGFIKKVGNGQIDNVIGLVFKEEHTTSHYGSGWLFIIKATPDKSKSKPEYFYSPAKRVGKKDIFARVPELNPLHSKKISVAGLGCIGSPAALEFAKAGIGKLFLVDHDKVDPATTVRWSFGIPSAAAFKIHQIASFIKYNYPYTSIGGANYQIGRTVFDPQLLGNESKILNEFFKDAKLIFDSTAEVGVNHYLSRKAIEYEIPYICIAGTNNGLGGYVLRVVPGKTEGCWMCFRFFQEEDKAFQPPADTSNFIQPIGCADPTFTGSSFDLMNVSLTGVKLAVSTLCSGVENAYPESDWDIGILSLRDEKGKSIAPSWKTLPLDKHPKCPYCN